MAKISHTKIKQPSFGEKRPKLTYTKISRLSQITLSITLVYKILHRTLYANSLLFKCKLKET
jgi:hypothetical protein